jgi:hypothetical protein
MLQSPCAHSTVLLAWGLLLSGCAAAPVEPPEVALKRRVCDAVVTAYHVGVRPTALDVEVPSPMAGEPASRLMLTGDDVPLAEQCLGLPIVRPVTPAALPPPASGSCLPPPSGPPAASPAPPPGRRIDPSLDTRT